MMIMVERLTVKIPMAMTTADQSFRETLFSTGHYLVPKSLGLYHQGPPF